MSSESKWQLKGLIVKSLHRMRNTDCIVLIASTNRVKQKVEWNPTVLLDFALLWIIVQTGQKRQTTFFIQNFCLSNSYAKFSFHFSNNFDQCRQEFMYKFAFAFSPFVSLATGACSRLGSTIVVANEKLDRRGKRAKQARRRWFLSATAVSL